MMKWFSCIMALLETNFCSAQSMLRVTSNCDSNVTQVYAFVYNRLSGSNRKPGDKLVVKGRELISNPRGSFDYQSVEHGQIGANESVFDTIRLIRNGHTIQSFRLQVVPFCDVKAGLRNTQGAFTSVTALLASPRIVFEYPGCCYNGDYFAIQSFDMSFIHNRIAIPALHSVSDRFTLDQINTLRTLKPGDRVFFENIKSTCADCTTRILPSFSVTIR